MKPTEVLFCLGRLRAHDFQSQQEAGRGKNEREPRGECSPRPSSSFPRQWKSCQRLLIHSVLQLVHLGAMTQCHDTMNNDITDDTEIKQQA